MGQTADFDLSLAIMNTLPLTSSMVLSSLTSIIVVVVQVEPSGKLSGHNQREATQPFTLCTVVVCFFVSKARINHAQTTGLLIEQVSFYKLITCL